MSYSTAVTHVCRISRRVAGRHRSADPALPAAAISSPGSTIVRQHWRKVFNVAYKFVGKHDEAEDLTQDIFLKIFKSLDTFDRRANFQTWLISVSRNLCIDHYRSVRKERETIDRDVDAERAVAGVARAGPDRRARAARSRRAAARRRWRRCPTRCGRRC